MQGEKTIPVDPGLDRSPAAFLSKAMEAWNGVFVRILSVDCLALTKLEVAASHANTMRPYGFQMHLDPPLALVVNRQMLE